MGRVSFLRVLERNRSSVWRAKELARQKGQTSILNSGSSLSLSLRIASEGLENAHSTAGRSQGSGSYEAGSAVPSATSR